MDRKASQNAGGVGMKGVEVMDIRFAVEQSAIAQLCPEDRVDDVWDIVHTMELPQSQKQLDNDVFYALRELGIAR